MRGRHEPFAGYESEDFVAWLSMTWPHDCEHFLVTAIHSVLRAATSTEVSHDAVRVLTALGRHPGRIGSLSHSRLAAGLTASKADQRAVAVDAVLGLRRAGRLNADGLAAGLVSIRGPATLTRVAQALRDVAAGDRQSSQPGIDTIAAALPALDGNARGLHALLELMREELLREGRPLPTKARPWLAQIRGGSRAAKAAAALLATTGP